MIHLYDKGYSRSPRWEKLQEKVIVAADQRGCIVELSSKKSQGSPQRVLMQDWSKNLVVGKYRMRRHPGSKKYQPHSREINEGVWSRKKHSGFNDAQTHVAVPRNQLEYTMILQGHHIPGDYFPHYYAPLPFWCLQTLISRLAC